MQETLRPASPALPPRAQSPAALPLARPANEIRRYCEPLYSTLLRFLAADVSQDASALHAQLRCGLEELRRQLEQASTQPDDIACATFAMAAFADELIVNARWLQGNAWPLLQTDFFVTNHAGTQFFARMRQIQEDGAGAVGQGTTDDAGLLEVYYLCLLLGFRGTWTFDPPEHVRERLEQIVQQCRALPAGPLAPHGGTTPDHSGVDWPTLLRVGGFLLLYVALFAALVLIVP
jgi:type IV/VI secretion system ImpK/VasF family protein